MLAGDPVASQHCFLDIQMTRLALLLVRQGRLLEAEKSQARAAIIGSLRTFGRNSADTGSALRVLTRVIFERGRFQEAETLARAAVDIFGRAGVSPVALMLAWARDELGMALVAQDRWQEALAVYEAMRQGIATDSQAYEKMLAGNIGWAIALLNTGNPSQALEMLETAFQRWGHQLREKRPFTAEVRGLRAMA